MESGRRKTRAALERAASAQTGLADVVCGFGNATVNSVADRAPLPITSGLPRCERFARAQPLSRQSAALRSYDVLSLSVHNDRGASSDWRVVETRGAPRISSDALAGPVPVKTSRC